MIQLSFETINISPEREKIEVHNFEKKIVDGKEELVQNGVAVKGYGWKNYNGTSLYYCEKSF